MDLKTLLVIAGVAVLFLNPALIGKAKELIAGLLANVRLPKLATTSGNAAQTFNVNPAQDAVATTQKRHGLNIVQDLADALVDNSVAVAEAKALIDPILPKLVVYRGAA